jgi:hypothetical protein
MVVAIYKGGGRSLVSHYCPVRLTSVVSKQMERFLASYLKEIWDKKIWGFHGGDYEEWCLLGCYAVWLL